MAFHIVMHTAEAQIQRLDIEVTDSFHKELGNSHATVIIISILAQRCLLSVE